MGFMRWLRGGDENSAATSAVSAGLAEIDGLFRPSKHKQTEHIQESKRKRVDVAASGIDLDRGVAVIPSVQGSSEDSDVEDTTTARRTITRTVWKPRPEPWWSRLSPSARRRRRRQRAKAQQVESQQAEAQKAA
ncbi:hypothetical protein [Rugosimonospora africana]|uniref:Uncharacterized protein n=1 Tax=Rugosimonospora africana TaxID=556532 RepID=A0A8J3QL03_9ACTN|nr:hypothetical protein [Rugosimonospora africana]GIH12541.1 hypothetical protein Raf01_07130 [Rugosimonospora africana]